MGRCHNKSTFDESHQIGRIHNRYRKKISLWFSMWQMTGYLPLSSELLDYRTVSLALNFPYGFKYTIPKKWFSRISSQIIDFDLSNNQIMGKLPHPFVFPNADIIDLSYNCLQGPIPLWYTNGTWLSRNFFFRPYPIKYRWSNARLGLFRSLKKPPQWYNSLVHTENDWASNTYPQEQ